MSYKPDASPPLMSPDSPPRLKMTVGRARALLPLLGPGEDQVLADQLWADATHHTSQSAWLIAQEVGVWPTNWQQDAVNSAPADARWRTAMGSVLRRRPTDLEHRLGKAVIECFGPRTKQQSLADIDMDLVALQLSNILANVCDYTPGEKTVAQAEEEAALTGVPFTAEHGILAFISVLRACRPHGTIIQIGPEELDRFIKAALKGEV